MPFDSRQFVIEDGLAADAAAILALYRSVAAVPGGLARRADEVSESYVGQFLARALDGGVILLARRRDGGPLAGEIHCYPLGPRVFAHVLGELTIAVHPAAQGAGVGRALFERLLEHVRCERGGIRRVELVARESNRRALAFYRSLGFREEGRLEGRIQSVGGGYEADIPMAWQREGPG